MILLVTLISVSQDPTATSFHGQPPLAKVLKRGDFFFSKSDTSGIYLIKWHMLRSLAEPEAGVMGSALMKRAQQSTNLKEKRFLEPRRRQTPLPRGLCGAAEEEPPEHCILVLGRIFLKNSVKKNMVNTFGFQ